MSDGISEWHAVAALADIEDDTPLGVSVQGIPVALCRQGDEIFALHDLCSHGRAKLSEGFVENGSVECPLHQGRFDLRTGAPLCKPVTLAVRTFPVRIRDGQVEVGV